VLVGIDECCFIFELILVIFFLVSVVGLNTGLTFSSMTGWIVSSIFCTGLAAYIVGGLIDFNSFDIVGVD